MEPTAASSVEISEVALFTARPMYWTLQPVYDTAKEHAEGVIKLLQWCMQMPGSQLGVDPQGLGCIVRSLYALRNKRPGTRVDQLLDSVGASEDTPPWLADDEHFGSSVGRLLRYVRSCQERQTRPGDFIWLEQGDAQWWTTKTAELLKEYTEAFRSTREERFLLGFLNRHRCAVFAPFDGHALWGALQASLSVADADRRERTQRMLAYHGLTGPESLTTDRPLYWSWRLIDFGVVGEDLLYQPTLALWSAWPASQRWAPSPTQSIGTRPLSAQEATSLIERFLWEKVETFFSAVRLMYGLGVTEPEFAGHEVQPPVFYYMVPTKLATRPQEYQETDFLGDLYFFTKYCLGSDDPFSSEIAWGVLEGDVVALRCERVHQKTIRSWYLFLPFLSKPTPGQEARAERERDIDFIVDKLTFLELSIGHEARDIATDLEQVRMRQALWGGSLDMISEQVTQAGVLYPLIRPAERSRVQRELSEILALLHQWRSYLEKVHSDASQVIRKYHSYRDASEDFLRRALTFSFPFSGVHSLVEAILDFYPYHYLHQPVSNLLNMIDALSSNMTHITEALGALLSGFEHVQRERQEQAAQRLSVVLGLLALLIAVPEFIPGAELTAENYPAWLSQVLPLTTLELLMRILVMIFTIPLLYFLIEAVCHWFYSRFSRVDPFLERLHRIWELVDSATNSIKSGNGTGQDLEKMDNEASLLLGELWQTLRETTMDRQASALHQLFAPLRFSPKVRRWLEKSRRLRYLIMLFDLAPQRIPLPRTICVLRYKSTDFHRHSTVSESEFGASLRLAGLQWDEIEQLNNWLSSPANRNAIDQMEAREFVRRLKERGLSADRAHRDASKWSGDLEI